MSVGRAERRRSPCVTRVCERASISASHRLTSPPLTAVSVLTEHRVEKGINRSGRYWGRRERGRRKAVEEVRERVESIQRGEVYVCVCREINLYKREKV